MRGLVVDLFAGGGGASVGLEAALGRKVDVAINHDETAIAVHAANHPGTRHFTEDVWTVDPMKATGGRPVDLLWASPDCTHFSIARGGKPNRSKKIRSLAWAVVRWAKAVRPKVILLENVREFQTWGPLDGEGRIIPHLKGRTFKCWLGNLRGLGYEVDWRILNAADYGAPTNRRRLFLIARCDGKPVRWPERTHGPGGALPYHTAAECIDWSIPCPSIFERKKPLAEKTLWRIANGIRRFVLESPSPFIVQVDNPRAHAPLAYPLTEPLRTVHTGGAHAVVAPSIVKVNHGKDEPRAEDPTKPLSTVTATQRGHAVIAPLLAATGYGERTGQAARVEGVEEPLPTVVADGIHRGLVAPVLAKLRGDSPGTPVDGPVPTVTAGGNPARPSTGQVLGLVAPSLVQIDQQGAGPRAVSPPGAPLPTTTVENRHALCAAFLAKHFGGHETPGTQLPLPLDTVTTKDHHALAAASLVKLRGQCHGADPAEPMPTVTAGGFHTAEVRAFLLKYYGTAAHGKSLFDPADTVTTKDRLGLVTVEGVDYQIVDIGMRMLEPHELLRAQFGGFAEGYDLGPARTKSAKVRLIGNSVCPDVVRALVEANTRRAARKVAAA